MTAVTVIRNRLHHISSPSSGAAAPMNLQGIVTILRSDDNTDKNNYRTSASIRRTLSADMSSKKWLQQNGFFSSTKKISSSEVLNHPSEEEETELGQDEVWRTIQARKQRNDDDDDDNDQVRKPTSSDLWGSILQSKKTDGSDHLPPPYIHPLVKRSASSLSEKSLEICTESLGSENGSDRFSSDPDSDFSGDSDDQDVLSLKESDPFQDLNVVKYKESPARPFPPPLNSIAGGGDGTPVHMQSRRENGRLVLEAVSVPPRNFFQAERGQGKLVLTLVNSPVSEKMEEVFDEMEDLGEEEEEEEVEEKIEKFEEDVDFLTEENLTKIIRFQKTGVLMNNFISLRNENPTWNSIAAAPSPAVEEEDELVAEVELPVTQSLPPRPPVGRLLPPPQPPTAASFINPYEYFWRNKGGGAVSGGFGNTQLPLKLNKNMGNSTTIITTYGNHQELVLIRGSKTEYSVPYLEGCKESKKSLLIWEPFCIATS